MQALARDGMTAAQVAAALTSRAPLVAFGADLLDLDGNVIRPLDSVTECTVTWNGYADVHRTVDLTLAETLDWRTVRIRPWQSVGGARFDVGVFGLETPETGGTGETNQVTGYDRLTVLQRIIGDTYWVAKSGSPQTFYTAAARQAIADAGASGVNIQSDADAVELADDMVWALDPQAPASYLRVVNDLLAAVGYRGLWADEDGIYRSIPFRSPAERPSEWIFDLSDGVTNIVGPDRSLTNDNWQSITAWRFLRNSTDTQPTEGDGLYTVGDWDDPDATRAFYAFDAADQASLVAQGDQQVRTDTSKTRLIQIQTGPLPCLAHFDIVTYRDPDLGIDTKAQIRSWTQPLHDGATSITMEVVDG